MTFLDYNGNLNTSEHFLKTDSKLTVDHNLVLKSKRTVIPSEHQHHVIPLSSKYKYNIVVINEISKSESLFAINIF